MKNHRFGPPISTFPNWACTSKFVGKKREDYEYRERIFNKNGYHIVFIHLYKEQKKWKKYLVMRLTEMEDLRQSEIEKIIGSLKE